MANTSISNLSAGAAVSATDVMPNVQTAGVGPVKTTAAQLKTFMSASPTLVTPNIGAATGTSLGVTGALTTGTQQSAQGSIVLANTAAGAFSTTIQSSNSATAAWTFTLPVATPATNGSILTSTTAGVSSWTATLPVANGGTGLTSGTSGGVLYYSATGTLASSGALTANALVIGGGAGAAPSTTTTGANVLTFLGTPSSANLAAAVTDETGSGSLVFGTSPQFTNGIGIGVAPAYSVDIKASSAASAIHLGPSTGADTGVYMNAPGDAEVAFTGGANYSSYSGDYQFTAKSTLASGVIAANGATIFWGNSSLTAGNVFTITRRLVISSTGTVTALGVYNTAVGATNKAAYVDSTGLIGYLSSLREAKINIAPMASQNWVYNLAPVTFNYRAKDQDGNYTDQAEGNLQYGLIAEEVALQNPDFCYYDDEGNLEGVAYDRLVVPLLKAIQELKAEVDALKAAK